MRGCALSPSEACQLYSALSDEQRDELLQCLLLAASGEGAGVTEVIEALTLTIANEEMQRHFGIGHSGLGESGVDGWHR